ncbi:hypothetical protein [Aristaeella lactis]|uniref:Uncharacterized protein n=1 Tax=Aristaeella lactis TaxID=3046383 RepID=A0AC61PN01_9FIRM|nr:hypothetical protein [Aristaeella lactis]QUA52735.1 hypothetical protein JYE50_13740 [Aristaeella lactis]SMC72696.1 hypothetical protein SAMN06297397_2205 [Aristaeella lactis]
MTAKEYYYQEDNVEYIKNTLGTEQWIQIAGRRTINNSDAAFWCGLVDAEQVLAIKEGASWDIGRGTSAYPGFEQAEGKTVYKKCLLDDGYEPIIFDREFYGVRPDYIEISQEFILLNNLYWDLKKNGFYAIHNNGECEPVIKYEDEDSIYIRSTYLYKYAAAKQKYIVLFYDIRTELPGSLSENGLEPFDKDYTDEFIRYGLWGNELSSLPRNKSYSVLMGKKLFPPMNIEKCGYWPFEPEKEYEDFIIGEAPTGEKITHSCDPNTLNNFFNSNPDEPLYFTPVFFRREVLQKYISKSELYKITDGRITCGSFWSMEIDNHHTDSDIISAFLGDLGTYLPEEEQKVWKIYNIISDEGISEVTYKRDFLCTFVDSNMEDHRFIANYIELNEKWEQQFGWPLFLSLSVSDDYNFNGIRIPVVNSQQEFDNLVLSLVKVLIDSLNEKVIIREANVPDDEKNSLKGIGKLEAWIYAKGAKGFEDHIKFLRDLQELRSTGTGHRKGKGYEKISEVFQLNEKTYADVFTDILRKANQFLVCMKETFLENVDLS